MDICIGSEIIRGSNSLKGLLTVVNSLYHNYIRQCPLFKVYLTYVTFQDMGLLPFSEIQSYHILHLWLCLYKQLCNVVQQKES